MAETGYIIQNGRRLNLKDAVARRAIEELRKQNAEVAFETDETLTLKDGVLSVNTVSNAEADNTLPITSAAVYTEIGNIDALLKSI